MIYHYTSVDAAFNIIKSNTIRLHPNTNLNDPYECFWSKKVFEYVCNDLMKNELTFEQGNNLNSFLRAYVWGYGNLSPIKYLACFSKESDSLALWHRYGQVASGIALGFDDSKLNVEKSVPTSLNIAGNFNLFDLTYDKKVQVDAVKVFVESFKNSQGCDVNDATSSICYMYLSFKNSEFADEKEARLLFSPLKDLGQEVSNKYKNCLRPKYICNGKRIFKIFEFIFPKDALTEVVLGPEYSKNSNKEVSIYEIRSFLKSEGYDNCDVRFSNIACNFNCL